MFVVSLLLSAQALRAGARKPSISFSDIDVALLVGVWKLPKKLTVKQEKYSRLIQEVLPVRAGKHHAAVVVRDRHLLLEAREAMEYKGRQKHIEETVLFRFCQ